MQKYNKSALLAKLNEHLEYPITTRTLTNWINEAGIRHPKKKGRNNFLYSDADLKKIEDLKADKLKENPHKKVLERVKYHEQQMLAIKKVKIEFEKNKENAKKAGYDESEYYTQLCDKYGVDRDEIEENENWLTNDSDEVLQIKHIMETTALFEDGIKQESRKLDLDQLTADLNKVRELERDIQNLRNNLESPFIEKPLTEMATKELDLRTLKDKLRDWRMYVIYGG